MEIIDYDHRTEYDYDYIRNGVEFSVNIDRGFTTAYTASVGYFGKTIPDSTEISYSGYGAGLEYRRTLGVHRQIFVTIDGERRHYRDQTVKSPFWSAYSTATLQPIAFGRFGISIDNVFETYQYDRSTPVFFSYVENRLAIQLAYLASAEGSLAIGPTFGFLQSGGSVEDEYTEVGGKLTVDYNSGSSLWLTASYEPGMRNYTELGSTSDSLYSDFVYHRLLLFATLRVWRETSLNVFANLEPENHIVPEDDRATTLFSADVTYGF